MSNCETCADASMCTKCEDGYYLSGDKDRCLGDCSQEAGTYLDTTFNWCRFCSTAINKCVTCSSSLFCTKCEEASFLTSDNSKCIADCAEDPGTWPSSTSGVNQCKKCSSSINFCARCTTGSLCDECMASYFLKTDFKACLDDCA